MEKEIKQSQIKKIIKDILALRDDVEKIGHRVSPDIAGFYGELIVLDKLKHFFGPKEYEVKFGSGQSKADIVLVGGSKKINIEVKTSRLKEEWFGVGYGFAINIKKCKKHKRSLIHPKRGKVFGDFCYFDYLIAVLLSEDLRTYKLYIFPRNFFEKHEAILRNKNKRFSSATHRLIFPDRRMNKTKEVTSFDKRFMKSRDRFEFSKTLKLIS